MFRIARLDRLRVYCSVPESSAELVAIGQPVSLAFDSAPGKTFQGKVVRTANAIDTATRTLLTQIDVENRDGRMLPGTFVTVTFSNVQAVPPVIVPGDTLITRSKGTMVALVRDGTVRLQPVVVGRDYGAQLEIREGLKEGDLVIVNPGDSAKEGIKVATRLLTPSQTEGQETAPQANGSANGQ